MNMIRLPIMLIVLSRLLASGADAPARPPATTSSAAAVTPSRSHGVLPYTVPFSAKSSIMVTAPFITSTPPLSPTEAMAMPIPTDIAHEEVLVPTDITHKNLLISAQP